MFLGNVLPKMLQDKLAGLSDQQMDAIIGRLRDTLADTEKEAQEVEKSIPPEERATVIALLKKCNDMQMNIMQGLKAELDTARKEIDMAKDILARQDKMMMQQNDLIARMHAALKAHNAGDESGPAPMTIN